MTTSDDPGHCSTQPPRRMTALLEAPITGVRSFSAAFRITVLALVCLMTAKAHAEWSILTVNQDRTVTIWIESSSIQRRDDYVFAWVIYDRENAAAVSYTHLTLPTKA